MTLTSVNDASPCQDTQNLSQINRVSFGRRPTLYNPVNTYRKEII